MKNIKSLLLFLVALTMSVSMLADEPFRNHRFNMFKVLPTTTNDIVFVGNSITDMHNWPEAFQTSDGSYLPILNRGVSGAVSTETSANLESILAGKPKKLFMMIGTNDLGTSGMNTAQQVIDNIRSLVQRMHMRSPQTKLYLYSILPSSLRNQTLQAETNDSIKNYVATCGYDNVKYIDLWTICGDIPSGGAYSYDNLHLTAASYYLWCNEIAQYLQEGESFTVTPTYNANTATTQYNAGYSGVHGMRATYFSQSPITADDILVIGDEMVKCGEWQELLGNRHVKNRGTNWGYGGTISTTSAFMPAIFNCTNTSYTNAAPKAVFLYTGTADANGSSDATTLASNYKAVVDSIFKYAPNTHLYMMGLLPTNNATYNSNIQAFNTAISAFADDNAKISYIDLYSPLADYVSNANYFTNNYLYGLGYVRVAQLMRDAMLVDFPSETFNVATMDEAQSYLDNATNRNSISVAMAQLKGYKGGNTAIGGYDGDVLTAFAAECQNACTVLDQQTVSASDAATVVSALNAIKTSHLIVPTTANTTGKKFQILTPNRSSLYLASYGAGTETYGSTDAATTQYVTTRWTLSQRADGAWNIQSEYDSSYLDPTSAPSTDNKFSMSAAEPSAGWLFSAADADGTFVLTSSASTGVVMNMTTKSGYPVVNWSTNASSDTGCQWKLVDVTDVDGVELPASVEEAPALVASIGLPGYPKATASVSTTLSSAYAAYSANETNANRQALISAIVAYKGNNSDPALPVDGQVYTIQSYIYNATDGTATSHYVQYDGSSRSMVSALPADASQAQWTAHLSGTTYTFESVKTPGSYLTYSGVATTGGSYTVSAGTLQGALTMRVDNTNAASSDAGEMGSGWKASSGTVEYAASGTKHWSTNWKLTPVATAEEGGETTDDPTVTIKVDLNNGSFTQGGTSYYKQWTSTHTSPTVTITTSANNIINYGDNKDLKFYSSSSSVTYTIACTSGYRVKAVNLNFVSSTDGTAVSVALNGGTAVSNSSGSTTASVSLSDVALKSFSMVVSGSSIFANTSNFVITLEPSDDDPVVDGRVYTIASYVNSATSTRYAQNNDGTFALVASSDYTEVPKNLWIAHEGSDGTFTFESALGDGNFLHHGTGVGTSGSAFTVSEGTSSAYLALYSTTLNGGRYMAASADGSKMGTWGGSGYYALNKTQASGWSTDFIVTLKENWNAWTVAVSGVPSGIVPYITYDGAQYVSGRSFLAGNLEVAELEASDVSGYVPTISLDNKNHVVKVAYEFNLASIFTSATDAAEGNYNWVRISNARNTNYSAYVASATATTVGSQATDTSVEGELFAFVGTTGSCMIYNKVLGTSHPLGFASSATDVAVVPDGANQTFQIYKSTTTTYPGYVIAPSDNSALSWNMHGGVGHDIKFYAATDGGATWNFFICDVALSLTTKILGRRYATAERVAELSQTFGTTTTTTRLMYADNYDVTKKMYVNSSMPFAIKVDDLYRGYTARLECGDEVYEGRLATKSFTRFNGNLDMTLTFGIDMDDESQYMWYSNSDTGHPYRIPSIVKANNGTLLAINDYRPGGSDIGFGEVDIMIRRSYNNGLTWTGGEILLDGVPANATSYPYFGYGYGDAATVCDCESDTILLMCVGGKTPYPSSSATAHPCVTRVYSYDNGESWTDPEDVTDMFLGTETSILYDSDNSVNAYGGFFGSGRIVQSKVIKKGSHYRIYAAMLCKGNNVAGAYVVYSDDFGKSWHTLSAPSVQAASGSDEPKVEELPNGDIILSGRKSGGRYFNIWNWSDANHTTGAWSTCVQSNEQTGGITVGGNTCNGEILIVDAVKVATGEAAKVVLQSLPWGSSRADVGFWFKEIDASTTYTGATFASGWTKGYQVSHRGSAYSTMCMQANGRIGFFYEEEPNWYCMVYCPLDIETITLGQYRAPSSPDITRDNQFDEADLDALHKILLGTVTVDNNPDNYNLPAADINGDNAVTISDITALIQRIFGVGK